MIEYLSPSVSSFVITLIGASLALGACGVLVGTLTHRYRKQAIDLAQRYLGARGLHRAAVGQLEKTLGQINDKQREVHLASANAQSTAQLNARLQDQFLASERKAHDLEDEARDLRSKLLRADTHNIELQTLAKQQQSILAQATDELDRTRENHSQAHAIATDRGSALSQYEQRVKDLVAQLTNATRVAHDLHAHNQSLSRQLGDSEKRIADSERTVLSTELQLASMTDKIVVANKVIETHSQHIARISELGGHLDQAQSRLAEMEKISGEKVGTIVEMQDRVLKSEAAHAEMIAESRDRLGIITKLTDELNNTRLALGNAHLQLNQHEAMSKENWLKLQDAHTDLASFKLNKTGGQTGPVVAPQPIVVQMPASPNRTDHGANLTPEQQDAMERAHATPGMQSVLTKMANELLKTQRKLDGTQGKLDELLSSKAGDSSGLADVIKANETEIASLKQDLQDARKRYEDAKQHNSAQATRIGDLSRQLRDLEKRYNAARRQADDLNQKLDEQDAHHQDLQSELDQRRMFPGMNDLDGTGFSQNQAVPSFMPNSVEPPRFVQNHDRILIDPPLDAISGMTPRDITALRQAAVMTPGDLASLSPEQLQMIVKPTIWRRPDYSGWIRQARQIHGKDTPRPAPEVQPELVVEEPALPIKDAAHPAQGSGSSTTEAEALPIAVPSA